MFSIRGEKNDIFTVLKQGVLLLIICLTLVKGTNYGVLPANHADRHTYFSPSETCRPRHTQITVRLTGCLPKRLHVFACHGTCHSRNVPEWIYEEQELRMVEYCTCCQPHIRRYRQLEFICPGRPEKRIRLRRGAAFECACRPCSDQANPEPEQPYEY